MRKKIIIATAAICLWGKASAQSENSGDASGGAQQSVQVSMSNALELSFNAVGLMATSAPTSGSTVTLPFTSSNDYANGVESTEQELRVKSNKVFNISVKTSSATFAVTAGGSTSASAMPSSILGIVVTDNQTGGSLGNGFSGSSYAALSATPATLIVNAHRGGNQNFTVKYKATPGFAYPAGMYSTDVVYTATQE
jgi:hypothetical protein